MKEEDSTSQQTDQFSAGTSTESARLLNQASLVSVIREDTKTLVKRRQQSEGGHGSPIVSFVNQTLRLLIG